MSLGIVKEIDTSDTIEYTLNEGAEIVRLLFAEGSASYPLPETVL